MSSHAEQADRLADDPRVAVADVCRRIIEELASSAATSAAFAEAGELMRQAADLLSAGAHEAHPVDPSSWFYVDHSPVAGALNPVAAPMSIVVDGTDVTADVAYGPAFEGAPGLVHGGVLAAAFDELIGMPPGLAGAPSMTGRLTIRYRSPTPLGEPLRYTASLERIDGRKAFTRGELRVLADGRLCAEAEGLFIKVDPSVFAGMTGDEPA